MFVVKNQSIRQPTNLWESKAALWVDKKVAWKELRRVGMMDERRVVMKA